MRGFVRVSSRACALLYFFFFFFYIGIFIVPRRNRWHIYTYTWKKKGNFDHFQEHQLYFLIYANISIVAQFWVGSCFDFLLKNFPGENERNRDGNDADEGRKKFAAPRRVQLPVRTIPLGTLCCRLLAKAFRLRRRSHHHHRSPASARNYPPPLPPNIYTTFDVCMFFAYAKYVCEPI